jgi:large subunit ribosomal protein L10
VNRTQKAETVASLNGAFAEAALVVVTHNTGLNVAEISELRRRMREAGARFRIAKNRLTKLALNGTSYEALAEHLTGPTALAFSDEGLAAAKVIVGFAKENESLVVLGGGMGEAALDAAGIKGLAELPSLDELRAQLIALINTPATRIAGILQAPAGQVARVLGAYGSQDGAAQALEDQKET